MGYVVPRFSSIYEDLGSNLPFASRLLMHWGQFLDAHGLAVALGTGGLIAGLVYAFTRPGSAGGDRCPRSADSRARQPAAHLPIGSAVSHRWHAATRRYAHGHGDAHVREAVVRQSAAAFASATQAVREGRSLGDSMEQYGLTTPVAVRMLRVGERSGNMGEMMERIAAFYDEELSRWVGLVTRLIEPALMSLIGIVIGVIVVLMYFPIFELAGAIQ